MRIHLTLRVRPPQTPLAGRDGTGRDTSTPLRGVSVKETCLLTALHFKLETNLPPTKSHHPTRKIKSIHGLRYTLKHRCHPTLLTTRNSAPHRRTCSRGLEEPLGLRTNTHDAHLTPRRGFRPGAAAADGTFSSRALWCSNKDFSALSTSTSLDTPAGDCACLFTTVIRRDRSCLETRHSRCSSSSWKERPRRKPGSGTLSTSRVNLGQITPLNLLVTQV